MADRNSENRSDRRPRWNNQQGERDQHPWQSEQFESGNRSWRDAEGQSQMGETSWNSDSDRGSSRGQYGPGRDTAYGSSERYGGAAGSQSGTTDFDARGYQDQGRPYGGYAGRGYSTGAYGGSSTYGASNYGSAFTGDDFGGRDFSRPAGDWSGRSSFGGYGAGTSSGAYTGDRYGSGERGFFERAGDEVASWFGDKDAARRREEDHSGKGPSNYTRSDERILEDVSDRITDDWRVDGRNIQVTVDSGEVTLDGTVTSREHKRRAEDVAEAISGVKHVQNNLRVATPATSGTDTAADSTERPGPFI